MPLPTGKCSARCGRDIWGMYETELQTSQEPYVLTLHFEDEPEDPAAWNIQMQKKAVLMLALIDNAGAVEWTHPAENGTETYRWRMDLEQAGQMTGIQDIKACAEDPRAFRTLCERAAAMRENVETAQAQRTEEGWKAPDGSVYRYPLHPCGNAAQCRLCFDRRFPHRRGGAVLQRCSDDTVIQPVSGAT